MTTPARTYVESFNDGPGGWYGWVSNFQDAKSLETGDGRVTSRSPWWIDYNHAPPGAGYMHLLFMINTRGVPSERHRAISGENRFVASGFGTDFTDARLTLRLKGELLDRDTRFVLLCQGRHDDIGCGWLLTGQPITVTEDWSETTISCAPDPGQWTELGSRHDRTDTYGKAPLSRALADVNTNILLVLFGLDIAPMGPLDGDPHRLRPEVDYPVWRHRLPEGYVTLDEVRLEAL